MKVVEKRLTSLSRGSCHDVPIGSEESEKAATTFDIESEFSGTSQLLNDQREMWEIDNRWEELKQDGKNTKNKATTSQLTNSGEMTAPGSQEYNKGDSADGGRSILTLGAKARKSVWSPELRNLDVVCAK